MPLPPHLACACDGFYYPRYSNRDRAWVDSYWHADGCPNKGGSEHPARTMRKAGAGTLPGFDVPTKRAAHGARGGEE